MFLIQVSETNFIDAAKILIVRVTDDSILYWLTHTNVEADEHFMVDEPFRDSFINHLQAFNTGISNIETAYHKMKKDD